MSRAFLNNVRDVSGVQFTRAVQLFVDQPRLGEAPSKQDEILQALSFYHARDEEDERKTREIRTSNEEELRKFTKWISSTRAKRYYFIHLRKHAMGLTGSWGGPYKFFDPNGGIVTSRDVSQMGKFMKDYFVDSPMRQNYEFGRGAVCFEVEKIKTL